MIRTPFTMPTETQQKIASIKEITDSTGPKNPILKKLMEDYQNSTNKNAVKGVKVTKLFKAWLLRVDTLLEEDCNAYENTLRGTYLIELHKIANLHGGECLANKFMGVRERS